MAKKDELRCKLEGMKKAGLNTIDDLIELVDDLFEALPELENAQTKKRTTSTKLHKERELEVKVKKIMRQFGIPAHVRGYQYLTDAIVIGVLNKESLKFITKTLYPEVAKKNGTTSSRVERDIRNAIELVFDRGNMRMVEQIFKHSMNPNKGKATNNEFICTIVDHIRMGDI